MSATPADRTELEGQVPPDTEGPGPDPEYAPPPEDDGAGPEDETEEELKVPEVEEPDDEELLEPKTLPVTRIFIDRKGRKGEYEQKGLGYFGKIELYGLLGRAVEIVMDGGLGIDDLMGLGNPKDMIGQIMAQLPEADTAPDADEGNDEIDAGKMLAAFAKVVSIAPEMLMEAYCVALAIPKGHRKWAMDFGLPDGVDDEMGLDILHTFIDQNWGVMEDFFARELPKIFKRAAKARARHRSAGGR